MTKRTFQRIIPVAVIVIFLGLAWFRLHGGSGMPYELQFFAFNTMCRISIWGETDEAARAAAREIFRRCNDMNTSFNRFDTTSELSRFNSAPAGEEFSCSEDFHEISRCAVEASIKTEGCFDSSVLPLIQLWKKVAAEKRIPAPQELENARNRCGMQLLSLGRQSVTKQADGFSLDFGGLAKGYALEKSREILESRGIRRYMLNYGGNICCSQTPPPWRRSFIIGIRDPQNREKSSCLVHVRGCAVSTSGNYERGTALPHIYNPHTGAACDSLKAVTVITPSCIDSDIFSTAVFVGGEELARRLADSTPGTTFIITRPDDSEITISGSR